MGEKDYLKEIFKPQNFSGEELTLVLEQFNKHEFSKNEYLIREGKTANYYFFVESGYIRSYAVDPEGNDITTKFFGKNDIVIDWHSFFLKQPCKEAIQAMTDCVVWKVFFDDFMKLFHIESFREVGRTRLYRKVLSRIALADLVRIHIFRLIGSFFLILAFYETLPPAFALIAGFGDVLTALTSLFVAAAIHQKKSYAVPLTFAWNTFGLLDILATATMAFFLTKISIETGARGVDTLAAFPFCYIPAFAPATIIFLHLSVYRKLIQAKK